MGKTVCQMFCHHPKHFIMPIDPVPRKATQEYPMLKYNCTIL